MVAVVVCDIDETTEIKYQDYGGLPADVNPPYHMEVHLPNDHDDTGETSKFHPVQGKVIDQSYLINALHTYGIKTPHIEKTDIYTTTLLPANVK